MKKRSRKVLSVLLVISIVVSVFCTIRISALSQDNVMSGNCSASSMLSVAQSQVGVTSGYHLRNKYTLWLGTISGYGDGGYGYPWCSTFISWCANQAGCLDVIYKTASCNNQWAYTSGEKYFTSSGYTPKPGDLIFFDYGSSHSASSLDHVGIVEYYDSSTSTVHTIEGNYDNSVARVSRNYYSNDIYGFISPDYSPEIDLGTLIDLGDSFSARIRNISLDKVITFSGYNAVIGSSMNNKIARQIWKFYRNSNGSYRIVSCLNDTHLDLHNFDDYDGGNVECVGGNGSTAQNWFIYQHYDGSLSFRPECSSDKVLDVRNGESYDGNNIQIWTYTESDNQKFAVDKCAEVLNSGNDFVASIEHTEYWKPIMQNDDGNVVLTTSSKLNMDRILWHFVRDEDNGWYTISSYHNGKCLDVTGDYEQDGANVECSESNNSDSQHWYILRTRDSDGVEFTYLKSACSNKNLDLYYNSKDDGTNIEMWEINSTNAQRFSIYGIGGETSYSLTSDKSEVKLGEKATITVDDTTFVISYKFHIIAPDGTESVVDNGCNNLFEFQGVQSGTYKIFAEVTSPVSSCVGSVTDKCIEIIVSNTNKLGDVDQNGSISVADAILIQKHIANIITLADEQFTAADVDQNDKITVADAIMIQKHIANIITIS